MQTIGWDAAWRPGVGPGIGPAALVSLLLATSGMAFGQLQSPRYQSPLQAPTPHLNLPVPEAKVPGATVVEDVIVRVNDQIIDRSDVEREERALEEAVKQGKMDPSEFQQAQKDLLRTMIDEQLLLSRAKELDLSVDAELVRLLDGYRKQNNLDSLEQKDCPPTNPGCTSLEQAVRSEGMSYEDFKAAKKNELLRNKVVGEEVGRTLHRPTLKEEQAYYDLHKQEWIQPEQVRLSEIMIPTPDNPTDAQIAKAQATADEVAARLKAGDKFEDLAQKYSSGETAARGGELGLFEKGKMGQVLDDATFPLKAGESTAPIRTKQGYVVLQVTEHIPAGPPPMKDVEEKVEEGMYGEAMQPAYLKYMLDLRDKAYIDIEAGFVDTGASPHETKVVLEGSTLPQPKKKPETEKQRLTPARPAPAAPASSPGASSTGAATPQVAGTVPPLGSPAAPTSAASSSSAVVANALAAGAPAAKVVNVSATKKRKKIKREKIRFGQAPRNTLPAAPEETLAAGADQGPGSQSMGALPASGEAISPIDEQTNVADNTNPLAPVAAEHQKTRYSDRAASEDAIKAAEKAAKEKRKALDAPATVTTQQTVEQKVEAASLDLNATPSKKKKKNPKGTPKERMQDQAAAPAAAKPTATPIPPKSVRDNGEPAVTPAPATQPSTPANAAPPPQ